MFEGNKVAEQMWKIVLNSEYHDIRGDHVDATLTRLLGSGCPHPSLTSRINQCRSQGKPLSNLVPTQDE